MEYTVSKNFFDEKDIDFLYVVFENGDYLSLSGAELADRSVKVYDKLVRHDKGYCSVAESGYIRFKIKKHVELPYANYFLHDPKEYEADRKKYVERRCTAESRICEIWFFNANNWHYVLLGNVRAEMDGKYLRFEFLPQPAMGGSSDGKHHVCLGDVKKEDIFSIDLDFENCESFSVYNEEISDVNLTFDEELRWGSAELYRKVNGGYIKLKLRKSFDFRENHLFDNKRSKKRDFERRLCGKKGFGKHDICHLYIRYYYTGFGNCITECVEIDEIKSSEEIARLEKKEEETGGFWYAFESGYGKKTKDGTILLTFGKNAKKTIKELSKHGK